MIRQTSSVLIPPHGSSSSSSGTDDSVEDDDDGTSVAGTETTETTLVGDKNDAELQEQVNQNLRPFPRLFFYLFFISLTRRSSFQIESLKNELETWKSRCEKVEREKSDILLRRLASYDTTSSKTAATEVNHDKTKKSKKNGFNVGKFSYRF